MKPSDKLRTAKELAEQYEAWGVSVRNAIDLFIEQTSWRGDKVSMYSSRTPQTETHKRGTHPRRSLLGRARK